MSLILHSKLQLESLLEHYHSTFSPLAFTNGCFDVLHAGHVEFLSWAKVQALECRAQLLVGLNTDESVRRLKGPARPINNQADRAAVMAALSAVDLVAFFGEDTPFDMLKLIKPRLILKSSQYEGQDTPERSYAREHGVELRYGPYRKELSTSRTLKELEKSVIEPEKGRSGLTAVTRARIISEVHDLLYASTESFEEQHIGSDLAYLLSGISHDNLCEWPEDRPIVALLRKLFPKDHAVWRFIEIEE